ncbi:MAG: DNA damage-inducible protein DinB, partial [Ignavibacteriaceae bacterium]
GFEQDEYVANSNFTKRILTDLIEEYRTLRASNIILFNSFTENELSKKGYANESEISVLSLAFIIAGHELHHIKILKERYLKVLD